MRFVLHGKNDLISHDFFSFDLRHLFLNANYEKIIQAMASLAI